MSLIFEVGKTQRIKYGEVICGDAVEVVRNGDELVVVLSDGLGSGVKANILSNLTTKIISKMVSSQVPLEDIVETVVGTLPVCAIRGIAYSTFTILKAYPDGKVDIIDFDGVPPILLSKGFVDVVERTPRELSGKIINEATLQLNEGDYLFISSDGVTEAGLGLTLPMGLQTSGVVKALKENVKLRGSAQDLANQMLDICMSYYINEPGDDTTAVTLYLRQARECTVMTGAPLHMEDDPKIVADFQNQRGKKIICGGTTAQIFARETGRLIEPIDDLCFDSPIPPTSHINGVDLVTEGIITMNHCTQLIDKEAFDSCEENGAVKLLKQLMDADKITLLIGTQISEAYDTIELSNISRRSVVTEKLTEQLRKLGKEVIVRKY